MKPDSIKWTPIKSTTGPVTIGGKILFKTFDGVNDKSTLRSPQRDPVANKWPYPAMQGCFTPFIVSQMPLSYIMGNDLVTIVMVEKDVPTTESKPVPK